MSINFYYNRIDDMTSTVDSSLNFKQAISVLWSNTNGNTTENFLTQVDFVSGMLASLDQPGWNRVVGGAKPYIVTQTEGGTFNIDYSNINFKFNLIIRPCVSHSNSSYNGRPKRLQYTITSKDQNQFKAALQGFYNSLVSGSAANPGYYVIESANIIVVNIN